MSWGLAVAVASAAAVTAASGAELLACDCDAPLPPVSGGVMSYSSRGSTTTTRSMRCVASPLSPVEKEPPPFPRRLGHDLEESCCNTSV
jgi:hypothetical protein